MDGDANSDTRPVGDSPRSTDHSAVAGAGDTYDPQQIIALARHPPPGASVYPPSATPSPALNPRSCVTCRRRKVRCDKHMPCSNCRRALIPCIFPAPGRAPRRPRPKDPNAPTKQPSSEREIELMKRLRKLEGIVEELSGQIEVESVRHPYSPDHGSDAGGLAYLKEDHHNIMARVSAGPNAPSSSSSAHDSPGASGPKLQLRPTSGSLSDTDSLGKPSPDVHKQFGRLVLNERGVTRYVSSSLWSSINDELDELRKESQDLSDDESIVSDIAASPDSAEHERMRLEHQSFVLGYRSADVDLKKLHPMPSQIPFIWQVYQENVDPILKVVHVPSMSKIIKDIRHNLDNLNPSTEALMFSIYYAAITSLDEEEVQLNFGTQKKTLVQKYRFAVEQALAKAEFLTKPDFTIVQALMLFLVLVRRHDDTRFAWSLTGLLIRLSQALGLHRDGSHFPNLKPFQIEMRRRLFWAVCVLDLRSAEDQGTELTIVSGTFDTQIPLNINDADISPDSTSLPKAREGTTDMTFSLIRYEICSLSRRLHTVSAEIAPPSAAEADKTLEEREALLAEVSNKVENSLLRDSSNPMYWVASIVTRIIVAKMTLVIYQPVLFPGPDDNQLSDAVRARLLNAALDVFEYSHVLNTDPRCKQWRWLFQTWSHWHALAYTLIEVSHRPWGPKSERAWGALNLTYQSPNPAELEKLASHHAVWMPLRKLYIKVKKHREAEIVRLQTDPEAAQELDFKDQPISPPHGFGTIPSSRKGAVALDRWRKLVNISAPQQQQQPQEQPQLSSFPRQLPRSQTMPQASMSFIPEAASEFAKPEIMEFIDDAMADPSSIPTDFAPLWASADPTDLARAAFLPYQPTDDPTQTGGTSAGTFDINLSSIPTLQQLGRTSTSMSMPLNLTQSQQQQQQEGSQQPTPHGLPQQSPLNTNGTDENLPTWLWPANGTPDIMQMPTMGNGEDMDTNMDEGFDWQTWQESLGRYEVETNGGRAGNTWGAGF
ncbi:fungal-specific transcription factor domain-containing protein [Chaetomium sp. MPI-SDFR-AT-0129]|nr:fungal-specific transcription factor domain-containing protein [Chaetomium sp. MPI-SDFR-AT-0129]